MDHSLIRQQLRSFAASHLPKNTTQFRFQIYDQTPRESALGFIIDPMPFEGTVIAVDDTAIFVKTKRTEFAVIEKSLASQQVSIGSKILVTPYARRRFDGERADAPKEEVHKLADGSTYTTRTCVLGDATVRLPLPKPENERLACLIKQLETQSLPDGLRNISHLLVDAGAHAFSCVDPQERDLNRTPPAISFEVRNGKCTGRVTVMYDLASEKYAVELHPENSAVVRKDNLSIAEIGTTLAELVDDGEWRKIRIDVLAAKSRAAQRSPRSQV